MKSYTDRDENGYKVDATRGRRTIINPVSYKPDTLVQVWLDARKIVMLDNWLNKNSIYTRYMSEIVREILDVVVDQLLEAGEVEKVEFSVEATDWLKAKFNKASLNPGNRGKRNIMHNLTLDERRKSKMGSSDRVGTMGEFEDVRKSKRSPEATKAIYDCWDQSQEENRKAERERIKKEIEERLTFDSSGIAKVRKEGLGKPYTKEDRLREIAASREALKLSMESRGISLDSGVEGSGDKEPTDRRECLTKDKGLTKDENNSLTKDGGLTKRSDNIDDTNNAGDNDSGNANVEMSEEELGKLFERARDREYISIEKNKVPRRLSNDELEKKEREREEKDRAALKAMDNFDVSQLQPIDE